MRKVKTTKNYITKVRTAKQAGWERFFSSQVFLWCSVVIIILSSIFLRSLADIGPDTGFYIWLGKKIANGKRYYHDFIESNFPLSFYVYALEHHISQLFSVHPIIVAEITINLLALLSIYWSAQILRRSTIANNKLYYNAILISYFLGFFLRIGGLGMNEFGTKTSLLLICLYPYVSYSFERKESYSKKELIWRGALMGLIPCLKPHYLILIIFVESYYFWQRRSIKFFLEIDKLVMVAVGALYLALMAIFIPEFLMLSVPFFGKIYWGYRDVNVFGKYLIKNLTLCLKVAPIFVAYGRIKFLQNDKILVLLFAAASLLMISEAIVAIDQYVIFYAIALICCTKIAVDLLLLYRTSFVRYKFIIAAFVILPLFSRAVYLIIFSRYFSIVSYLWIGLVMLIIVDRIRFKKINTDNKYYKYLQIILLSCLLAASGILVLFGYFDSFVSKSDVAKMLICCALIFKVATLLMLICFEKVLDASKQKDFSLLSLIAIVSALFLLISTSAFELKKSYQGTDKLHSPNKFSEAVAYYYKTYRKNTDDEFFVFSGDLQKAALATYFQSDVEYKYRISFDVKTLILAQEVNPNYLLESFRSKVFDNKKVALLFVDKAELCHVGYLEYLLSDSEIRRLFLQNFQYVGRIMVTAQKPYDKGFESAVKMRMDKKDLEALLQRKASDYELAIYRQVISTKNDEVMQSDFEVYGRLR